MHVLMLCKRQYTGRDLLDDQYGRLWEIPEALAHRGHAVSGLTLSYRRRSTGLHRSPADVHWQSINAVSMRALYLGRMIDQIHAHRPIDVLLSSSDALCATLGERFSRRLRVAHVVDLYDNYAAFGLTKLPGVRAAFDHACRHAAGISVVTTSLATALRPSLPGGTPLEVIGNGVRTDLFHPMERAACRAQLGLPTNARLIGCAGALDQSRGIEDLFKAFHLLAHSDPDLHLVIAGPRDNTLEHYAHPRIIDLGTLDWRDVPVLINALDVSIVCNRDSAFGRFCYPLKLVESIACGVPVVAAAVGDTRRIGGETLATYSPGSCEELKAAIEQQLSIPSRAPRSLACSWEQRATQMERLLLQAQGCGDQLPAG